METLPDEMVSIILTDTVTNISIEKLIKLMSICKKWYGIISSFKLYLYQYFNRYQNRNCISITTKDRKNRFPYCVVYMKNYPKIQMQNKVFLYRKEYHNMYPDQIKEIAKTCDFDHEKLQLSTNPYNLGQKAIELFTVYPVNIEAHKDMTQYFRYTHNRVTNYNSLKLLTRIFSSLFGIYEAQNKGITGEIIKEAYPEEYHKVYTAFYQHKNEHYYS